jgi:hypothetical protein
MLYSLWFRISVESDSYTRRWVDISGSTSIRTDLQEQTIIQMANKYKFIAIPSISLEPQYKCFTMRLNSEATHYIISSSCCYACCLPYKYSPHHFFLKHTQSEFLEWNLEIYKLLIFGSCGMDARIWRNSYRCLQRLVWIAKVIVASHTCTLVCSFQVMEARTVNRRVFAVRTYFETKSVVQTQRRSPVSLIFLGIT